MIDWCCSFSEIPFPVRKMSAYELAVTEDRNLSIPSNHCVQSSNTITARPLGCNLLEKEERGILLCPNPHSWARLPNHMVCVLWRHSNLGFAKVPPFHEYHNNTTILTECYWWLTAQWLIFNKVVWKHEQTRAPGTTYDLFHIWFMKLLYINKMHEDVREQYLDFCCVKTKRCFYLHMNTGCLAVSRK